MYATKEAILAKQRLGGDVNCSIFIMDERAFNKEYSSYFERARQHGDAGGHWLAGPVPGEWIGCRLGERAALEVRVVTVPTAAVVLIRS